MSELLAEVPHTTFPSIDLGTFELRTFGFMVVLDVLVGAWLAARRDRRRRTAAGWPPSVAVWLCPVCAVGDGSPAW